MKTIGIDIGTSTVSAVLLDTEKRQVIISNTIPNDSFIETGYEWERIQDVSIIISKAKALLDDILDNYEEIDSIGLTCQMHGMLYVDADGKNLGPLYTWQDGRGNLMMDKQTDNKKDNYQQICGNETGNLAKAETYAGWISRISKKNVASGYGLVTHFYHMKNDLVPVRATGICTIGDYLGMILTGRKKPLMHITNAASFGLFNVNKGCFDEVALQAVGITENLLPEIISDFSVLGLYRGIPVTVAIGDNQASFLGSVGIQNNVILVNMGTGGQISVLSDVYFETSGIEARPFVKGKYLLAGSSLCGGRAYAILEKFFRMYAEAAWNEKSSQYDIMNCLANRIAEKRRITPGYSEEVQSNSMNIVTTFNGTRADPMARGVISNISEDNFTPEGLVYGVLDGMAQELYDMFSKIQTEISIEAKQLIASGNGLRKNAVLQEIFRQKFNAELILAPYEEEAACGAAISSTVEVMKNMRKEDGI